ncbi:MAG: hypothetical protein JW969_02120 [Spirochaetales bacterium]|nr:hypothetical protein [Spirochaetales bacterium]
MLEKMKSLFEKTVSYFHSLFSALKESLTTKKERVKVESLIEGYDDKKEDGDVTETQETVTEDNKSAFFPDSFRDFWEGVKSFLKKASEIFIKVNRVLSPRFLTLPDPALYFAVMFLFSFFVIAFEMVQFHVLLIVTNYLRATFMIGIAMLGISIGGIIAFYLRKIKVHFTILASAFFLFISIVLSCLNIINIGVLRYPYFLVLPFIFASIVISSIFMHGESTTVYFINLVASAAGVLFPILMLPLFKSENSLFVLLFVPLLILVVLSLRIPHVVVKIACIMVSVIACLNFAGFIYQNLSIPERIEAGVFEEKIISETGEIDKEKYSNNYQLEFFKRVYTLDKERNQYTFHSDAYDLERAGYFLKVLGFMPRFYGFPIPLLEPDAVLSTAREIPEDIFLYKLVPALKSRYGKWFKYNADRTFLERVYLPDAEGKTYVLKGDEFDRKRAKYLLSELGHIETLDLNFDVKYHPDFRNLYKIFGFNSRILLSEDDMLGRVEYTGDDDRIVAMAVDGAALDTFHHYNGDLWDARVPRKKNANIFVVGLSADGIVKSCKRLSGATVSGIEINPIIYRTMLEGQFARLAYFPYKDVETYLGEGRSFLENTKETFDIISLMNIHMEHGPICTLNPEYFHTVEATRLLLDKLRTDGYIVYEEILKNDRGRFFFLKFINTVKRAMREMGIEKPEDCIHVFSWDFSKGGSSFRTLTLKREPFTEKEIDEFNEFIKKLEEGEAFHNMTLLHSPRMKTDSSLSAFIRKPDELERENIPKYFSVEDFMHDVITKLNDPQDLRFMLNAYRKTGRDTFYLNKASLSEGDEYRLRSILDSVDYPVVMDLSPATDDSPFPFRVYKNSADAREIFNIILLFSLAILIPVLIIITAKAGQYRMSLIPPVLFVAVIGFGYMLVEIVLMQKFQRFIGAPMYSLVVVLGGLLLFSGIGSFVSRFLNRLVLGICLLAIPIFLAVMIFWLDPLFRSLAGLDFTSKLFASAVMILPLTFCMGMPFPQILEIVKKNTSAEYASLLFGVSGIFSTVASATSLLISSTYGFSVTFITGTVCYTAGLLLFLLLLRKRTA